jgi:phage gpG-like protein
MSDAGQDHGDAGQLGGGSRGAQRLAKTGRSLRRPFGRLGLFIRREAQRALRARVHEWGPATGRLAQSLAMRLDAVSVVVGSNLAYAAIQQFGGPVTPKGHKYLAIPVLPALRRRGVWPRDIPKGDMRFVPNAVIRIGSHSWTGPALVRAADQEIETPFDGAGPKGQAQARRRPRRKAGEVMFALVKRVTIKGRPYLQFSDAARAFLIRQIELEYQRAWRTPRSEG